MKEALVQTDLSVKIHDVPIPKPGPGEVLIKITYAGCNPKDWKYPVYHGGIPNSGDDMAGRIAEVGEGVVEFRTGDRVAAMHVMGAPHGSFAEYGIAPASTTFHIPLKTSFEEAVTLPLAALTAVTVLYRNMKLPEPWSPAERPVPLIIYGASSAVGVFAVKFARKSNIHPIITIAGKSKDLVQDLIDPSQGDVVFDYRDGLESVVRDVQQHVQRLGLQGVVNHAFDTICSSTSTELLAQLVEPNGYLNVISPRRNCATVPTNLKLSAAFVGIVHNQDTPKNVTIPQTPPCNGTDLGFIYSRLFTKGLEEGWLTGHPFRVWLGGLDDLSEALQSMQDGKVSGTKYVFKIV